MAEYRTVTVEELLGELNEVERQNAPAALYLAGDRTIFDRGPRVSVVGTRDLSPDGARRARIIAKELVKRGIVVVSGLAEGVDAIAHGTAIELGGRTIAVLGNGLGTFYPPSNRQLQRDIMANHAAVSQFAPEVPSKRTNFPQRNRTMALLSEATIIVEAGESSGTKSQGWEAIRLGRPLFLLESLADRKDLSWPGEMIAYGARVLSREDLDEVLAEIPERCRGSLPI